MLSDKYKSVQLILQEIAEKEKELDTLRARGLEKVEVAVQFCKVAGEIALLDEQRKKVLGYTEIKQIEMDI